MLLFLFYLFCIEVGLVFLVFISKTSTGDTATGFLESCL